MKILAHVFDCSKISLGSGHSCSILNGELFCWGFNNNGQLGNASSRSINTPIRIGNNSDWTHITSKNYHTCGIRNNGELYCWGDNIYGQLGDGTNGVDDEDRGANKNIPIRIGNNSDWTHISSGYSHTCGFRNNQLFCWGRNNYGQLGDGTNTRKNIPTLIGNNSDWRDISLGGSHTCGIRNKGELFCWGRNNSGNLGDETNDISLQSELFPIRVGIFLRVFVPSPSCP